MNTRCLIHQAEDSEEKGAEPNWERQETMVRKLQRKFPDQDKEVSESVSHTEILQITFCTYQF